jgi:hypothetical protein
MGPADVNTIQKYSTDLSWVTTTYTVLAVLQNVSEARRIHALMLGDESSGSNSQVTLGLDIDGGASNLAGSFALFEYNAGFKTQVQSNGTTYVDNTPHVYAGIRNAPSNPSLWFDGSDVSAFPIESGGSANLAVNEIYTLGSAATSNRQVNANYLSAAWDHALSAAAMQELGLNPWQLFRPQTRRIYVDLGVQAPTTQSAVIGAARIASRGVGAQVQRFMFRQPIGIFGGVVLDPPGQTAGAVVLANPMVGPPVMRQRARRPFLSGPVASGATSVLSPLVVHTYTARVPQVQASVKPAQVTHTYTAQTPQVRASVKPSQATHTYVGQVPQVRAQVRPGQVTHTYTARVPVVSAGTRVQVAQVTHTYTAQVPQVRAQVRPAQATHTYTARVPNIVSGASIIPPVATHAYTGRVPQVRAQVRPAQVTHSYTARVPQVQIATRVSAVLVTHSFTSRVPGFKTSIPAPRITHTYTSRVPVVVIAGAPLYGFGARARIGAASARDPWSRIGSASATDANKKIGSDKA